MRNRIILLIAIAAMLITGCAGPPDKVDDTPYSDVLAQRIAAAENGTSKSERPNYLPEAMFKNLPGFPEDFYQMRILVISGKLQDLSTIGEEYWQQPEWFPHFEDIGVPMLQSPPKDRFGAQGFSVYPADSVTVLKPGGVSEAIFWIKSGYLVETYQGMNLNVVYPASGSITTGYELPGGAKSVQQDPDEATKYFEVDIGPEEFILEPNFPIYRIDGTKKITLKITATEFAEPGNYVIGIDSSEVDDEKEKEWVLEYKNLYTSGGMTKLGRPMYQAFIQVKAE
ncbi:hypothetical protein JW968_01660 [Candidatus Woesearchaeota archaeon]|nr:hypothetical protein [Candidatus Woesearchaeota archaeon]